MTVIVFLVAFYGDSWAVVDPGEGPGRPAPPFLRPNEGPKKKCFLRPSPPPLISGSRWPAPQPPFPHPPYLKVWIRYCWVRLIVLKLPLEFRQKCAAKCVKTPGCNSIELWHKYNWNCYWCKRTALIRPYTNNAYPAHVWVQSKHYFYYLNL